MKSDCPVCTQPAPTLRVIEMRGVPVDTCTRCHGHWLDAGELERLAPGWRTEALRAALPTATRRCRHSRHHVPTTHEQCGLCGAPAARCPSCAKFLSQVRTEVCAVDLCGSCHGLWLDANELKALIDWHQRSQRPLAVGAAVVGTAAAAAAAAALSQVTAGSPERSRAAEVLSASLERAGDAADVVEVGEMLGVTVEAASEGLGSAAEAAVEGANLVGDAMGGLLEVVAGLFH
ncbi:TFIIB-type zinc ribbon-containing protein [Myxococcus qinghaiensis]|uniref:TFIIB-type zinc ribbon-containing protein n=1 Tax=Myxococcus qinghaiensis TaxID=2906758 RepID=UPI0020A7CFA9|nr:zf-TFIIB domain-containing protein [Myxococcus qinghaiensis]MCP3165127.1 zf-TFIIB domain-containing protein [Myxococcus qinghaiensis]